MKKEDTPESDTNYYTGPERRHARKPRRKSDHERRHRVRYESLVSDCRLNEARRKEDEDGFIEIANLYTDVEDQPQKKK